MLWRTLGTLCDLTCLAAAAVPVAVLIALIVALLAGLCERNVP